MLNFAQNGCFFPTLEYSGRTSSLYFVVCYVFFVVPCRRQQYENVESDGSTDDDSDNILRAEALNVSEELVLSFARRNGTRFEVALGKLLEKRSLSASSNAVKALNFTNPSVRGTDLKRSILSSEVFSKNMFNFKKCLMTTVGAKNESDLKKRILDFEFKSPLL